MADEMESDAAEAQQDHHALVVGDEVDTSMHPALCSCQHCAAAFADDGGDVDEGGEDSDDGGAAAVAAAVRQQQLEQQQEQPGDFEAASAMIRPVPAAGSHALTASSVVSLSSSGSAAAAPAPAAAAPAPAAHPNPAATTMSGEQARSYAMQEPHIVATVLGFCELDELRWTTRYVSSQW